MTVRPAQGWILEWSLALAAIAVSAVIGRGLPDVVRRSTVRFERDGPVINDSERLDLQRFEACAVRGDPWGRRRRQPAYG